MREALKRARRDIEEGRLWKARDRLTGGLVTAPTDQEALDLLGDVYYSMGDLPRAGTVWALTTRDDARAREAFDATRDRYGNDPGRILEALPVKAPFDDYPPAVAKRLRDMVASTPFGDYPPGMARRLQQLAEAPEGHSKAWGFSCCLVLLVGTFTAATAFLLGLADILEAASLISGSTRTDLSGPLMVVAVGLVAIPVAIWLVLAGLDRIKAWRHRAADDPLAGSGPRPGDG
jgi:hypothetical protein